MKHLFLISFTFLLALTAGFTSSCKKNKFTSTGNLEFSRDTIIFDTIFTTVGSTTSQLKVYNKDSKKLRIDEIELMGGENSAYRINFDGISGISFSDIEIEAKDSLYCFVEVTLDPNSGVLPLIVEDSIRFRTNGVDQYVQLAAWGQDAYFHYSEELTGNTINWTNDKPHVIYGYAYVTAAQTLNIPAGTNVYLHKGSLLYIDKGTLNINGTKENKVTFQGDRLEAFYDNVPGQYFGIYLDSATNCFINYAVIKNATTGIHIESRNPSSTDPTLTIHNTEIGNCASYGMLIFDRAEVKAKNTLIHSNGVYSLVVLQGAKFEFIHCDLLGFGTGEGTTPAVALSNVLRQNGQEIVGSIPQGDFINCLIYGAGNNQIGFDTIADAGITLNFNFIHSRIASTVNTTSPIFQTCFFSGDPKLTNTTTKDFNRLAGSSLLGQADPSYAQADPVLQFDLGGTPRIPPVVDIGALEVP